MVVRQSVMLVLVAMVAALTSVILSAEQLEDGAPPVATGPTPSSDVIVGTSGDFTLYPLDPDVFQGTGDTVSEGGDGDDSGSADAVGGDGGSIVINVEWPEE